MNIVHRGVKNPPPPIFKQPPILDKPPISKKVVGLQKGVNCLINIHALSYQPYKNLKQI